MKLYANTIKNHAHTAAWTAIGTWLLNVIGGALAVLLLWLAAALFCAGPDRW
jgi:hypothetical protein